MTNHFIADHIHNRPQHLIRKHICSGPIGYMTDYFIAGWSSVSYANFCINTSKRRFQEQVVDFPSVSFSHFALMDK